MFCFLWKNNFKRGISGDLSNHVLMRCTIMADKSILEDDIHVLACTCYKCVIDKGDADDKRADDGVLNASMRKVCMIMRLEIIEQRLLIHLMLHDMLREFRKLGPVYKICDLHQIVTECTESEDERVRIINCIRRVKKLQKTIMYILFSSMRTFHKSLPLGYQLTQTDDVHDHECNDRKKRCRRSKVCHGCGKHDHHDLQYIHSCVKHDNHDLHTDNKNHRCNCRICMNSLLTFTDLATYEINIPLCYPNALVQASASAEFRDILSHFCDMDILQVCVGGMGGFDCPFLLPWVPQVPRRLARFDDILLNPLEQICTISILESSTLSILEFFERKKSVNVEMKRKLFRLSMHLACFLQIMKDVVCYLSNKHFMFLLTIHKLMNNSILLTMNNRIKSVPLQSKGLMSGVEETKSGNTSSSSPENRREITRRLLKEFFLQEGDSACLKYETVKDSSQEIENIGIKKNKQGEKQESFDKVLGEDFYEMFTHVEVRNPVEVLVYPATQQLVLEPILNKFATPESTPSKHETMAVEFLRLCTMHDYPSTSGPSLLRLAQAGFYYEGNGNELVCFSCNFRKGTWNYHDSPREIHQRMSPNCKFLSQSGDGNIPIPREESTQDPPPSSPWVGGEVMADGPRAATAGEPANNTAHLASADCRDGQDQTVPPRRPMIVKHPEYANRATRLGSYANFPRHMKQHPADMTDAGFYYAGFGDCCRCYHCGIGLRNWDPEDNPWIEHARWSSECPYILKVKGQAFIDLVQEAARAAEMAQDEDSEGERDSVGSNRDVGSEKSGASNSSSGGSTGNSPASDELVENNVAKTSEATVSKGVSSGDSGFGSGSTVQAQPIKAPLRTAAAQSLIHDEKIKPKYVTAAIEDLVKAEGWGAFTKENIRKYLKINEENGKSTPSASNADPDVLKQQNKELKDLTVCKICLDEKVSIVFLPCGHLVACPQCAPALTKCPICRKNIKGTVRTNLVEKSAAK